VVELRDGKGREGFEGEFDLRGDLGGGRLGGDGNGAGEKDRVGQQADLGRRRPGAEEIEKGNRSSEGRLEVEQREREKD